MSELGYNLDGPVVFREGERLAGVPSEVVAEESMLGSFIESASPQVSTYESIKKQYEEAGVSPLIEGIRKRAAEEQNREKINKEIAKTADGQQSLEATEAILAGTPALSEDDITDLHRELARVRLMRTQAKTPEQKALVELKYQELVSGGKISPEQAITERMRHIFGDMDPSALSQLGGLLADTVPYASTAQFAMAFKEVFPEDIGITNLPRGELAMEFRDRMMKLDPETRYRTAAQFMDAVLSSDSPVTGKEFQNLMILQEALDPSGFQEGFAGINWDRVIGNLITVLDTGAMGGVARSLMRTGKGMFKPGSVLSTVNIVDQEAAAQLAAQGIKKDLSDALSMTPAEITEQVATPALYKDNVELLPADVIKHIDESAESLQDLMARTRGNTQIYSVEEQQYALRNFRAQAAQVNNAGIVGRYTARINEAETGLDYTATYGRINSDGKTVPFETAREAAEHAADQFPTATRVTVQERTAAGLLKDVPKGKTNFKKSRRTGEFVYTIEDHVPFAHVQSLQNRIIFEKDAVVRHGIGKKYFFDPASRFVKWISNSFAQAGDFGRGVQHQINTMVAPFTKIAKSKQVAVMRLLKEYEKQPFDTATLVRKADGDEDVIRGFVAYRQADEALYALENRNYRDDLIKQDAKYLVEGDYQGVGVRVSDGGIFDDIKQAGANGIDVWDPKKGVMTTMNARQAQRFYAQGNHLYRVKEHLGELSRQTDLVMVTHANQVRALPAQILNKIEGHIARYYKDSYFIRRNVKGTLAGRAHTNQQVLGVAKNKAEANTMVRQFVKDKKLTQAEVDEGVIIHDRSMTPSERATLDLQDKLSAGRMFYHSRASNVVRGIDGLAEVSDPIEALVKNIDSTSRHVAEAELLQSMKNRWMNTYGHLVQSKNFPMSKDELRAIPFADDTSRSKATELWDQIHITESINTREGEIWRDSIMALVDGFIGDTPSTSLWGKIKTGLTAPARMLADHSFNRMVRSLAFWHLIAGNPIRQIYVQSQQFLFLSALNPVLAPKIIFKDGPAVMSGFMMKDLNPKMYNKMKPIWSKALGMSTKEYDEFMDGFIKTGIPHSVDSHDYVANTLATFSKNIQGGYVRRAGRALWNVANTPLRWAKKAGFDVGELTNLTNTFMLARARYLKGTGKKQLKTRKDFETVAANARNLALDMTRTGALRYQEGGFSALTQFLSIQHKALLAMVPFGKFGNQSFTKAERARIAMGQAVLNGATGLGLYELYRGARDHLGLDIPDWAEDVIVGGLYESTINATIAAATGEDEQDFNIAGNVAPFSGINHEGVLDVLMGHKPLLELMAATNIYNRYTDAAKTIKAMYDYPELTGDEQLTSMISAFGTVTSGWNQYIRARAASRLGVHVSNKGSPTVEATMMSTLLEGGFGLQLRTVDEYYALMDQYSNEFKSTDTPWDSEKEIAQVAEAIHGEVLRITTMFSDELDLSELDGTTAFKMQQMQLHRMQETLKTQMQIMAIYDPIEQDRIWQRVQERAIRDRTQGRRNLLDNMLKLIDSGDLPPEKAEFAIHRLRASGLYNPETQEGQVIEHNIRLLMENMTMRKALSEENEKELREMIDG